MLSLQFCRFFQISEKPLGKYSLWVLSLWHSLCAFSFVFLELRKLTEINNRYLCDKFRNEVRSLEIWRKTNSLCKTKQGETYDKPLVLFNLLVFLYRSVQLRVDATCALADGYVCASFFKPYLLLRNIILFAG